MSDKLYTAYGEDKILNLENTQTVAAINNIINQNFYYIEIKAIQRSATSFLESVTVNGESATPEEVGNILFNTGAYILTLNGARADYARATKNQTNGGPITYSFYIIIKTMLSTNNNISITYKSYETTQSSNSWSFNDFYTPKNTYTQTIDVNQ